MANFMSLKEARDNKLLKMSPKEKENRFKDFLEDKVKIDYKKMNEELKYLRGR